MKVTSGLEINSEAKHFHTHTKSRNYRTYIVELWSIPSVDRILSHLPENCVFLFCLFLRWLYGPRFVSCRPVCLHLGTPYALRWHPMSREIKVKRCVKIQASSITSRIMTLLHVCWRNKPLCNKPLCNSYLLFCLEYKKLFFFLFLSLPIYL